MDTGNRIELRPRAWLAGRWSLKDEEPSRGRRLWSAIEQRVPVRICVRTWGFSATSARIDVGVEQGVATISVHGGGILGNPTTRWRRTPRNAGDLPRVDEYRIGAEDTVFGPSPEDRARGLVDVWIDAGGEPGDEVDVEVWAELDPV